MFKKSSLSFANGNCVEVQFNEDGTVDVRNSRDPEGGTLHFTPGEWDAFIQGARNGEFDRFGQTRTGAESYFAAREMNSETYGDELAAASENLKASRPNIGRGRGPACRK